MTLEEKIIFVRTSGINNKKTIIALFEILEKGLPLEDLEPIIDMAVEQVFRTNLYRNLRYSVAA